MGNPSIHNLQPTPVERWSNRILILASAGILFLTLYPFRFNFHPLANGASPFLLGHSLKRGPGLDIVLNVLLFVPFGFGVAGKLRDRGRSIASILLAAAALGAAFSYVIELLQLYIPDRDSGWEDVITNGSGSLLGAVFYFTVGGFLLGILSSAGRALANPQRLRGLAIALPVYCSLWLGLAALLQMGTRLSDWKPGVKLTLGNESSGEKPWRGQIRSLQIWDKVVSQPDVVSSNKEGNSDSTSDPPIVNYDFSKPVDHWFDSRFVPSLSWVPHASSQNISSGGVIFGGTSWISTPTMEDLVDKLQRTNQFTIHIVLTPENPATTSGRILSISDSTGFENMMMRQEKNSIFFWFRTPAGIRRAQLEWRVAISGDAQQKDLLYAYDGSNLFVFIDGKKSQLNYPLGPGAVMAELIRRIRPGELEGYNYAFYALIFCVSGAILGFAKMPNGRAAKKSALVTMMLTIPGAAFLLELILVKVSGRPLSVANVFLSFSLGFAGYAWSRTDERWESRRNLP
jgi:hypothetical protein